MNSKDASSGDCSTLSFGRLPIIKRTEELLLHNSDAIIGHLTKYISVLGVVYSIFNLIYLFN